MNYRDGDVATQLKSYTDSFGRTINWTTTAVYSENAGQFRDIRDKRAGVWFDRRVDVKLVCRKGLDKW